MNAFTSKNKKTTEVNFDVKLPAKEHLAPLETLATFTMFQKNSGNPECAGSISSALLTSFTSRAKTYLCEQRNFDHVNSLNSMRFSPFP